MCDNASREDAQKQGYTEEERAELAGKLEQDLDDFINSLEKKPYTDGWPEDRWEEEMEKHPFFMSKISDDPNQVSPLIEGLQQLKYGEEYNTPDELAQSYKEDGNFNYKHKKYEQAVYIYTKGIESKSENKDLMSQLYSNRALSQLKLKHYKWSLRDCRSALQFSPQYIKPMHTAAKCCLELKDNDQCIQFCNQILNILKKENKQDDEIVKLKAEAEKNKKLKLRDARMKEAKERKLKETQEKIKKAIDLKKINIDNDSNLFQDSQWYVHLKSDGSLVWPVIFAYPENNQTDFVENFEETTSMKAQLEEIFKESPAWDSDQNYKVDKLNIYFAGKDKKLHRINIDQSLGSILQHKQFIVNNGTPVFFVVIAKSKVEHAFLESYR
ncbi:tetratricopeptide repeat protein 4 [Trichogramma pretiosum]|uniref:tetratricopeptide repeat protein 4 n=1 Tax=Trichogramma pretiosum TaxID=7493 RepID=UPI0006C9CC0B|nr:tetratricopeptide repeat protein 4 [Trichogramma pretiosum]